MSTVPVCQTDLITIVKGGSKRIQVSVLNCDDSPFDLSNLEAASAIFRSDTEGSPVIKTLAASGVVFEESKARGKFEVLINPTDSESLYEGEEQTWAVYLDMGQDAYSNDVLYKVLLEETLTVKPDPVASF